MLANNCWWSLGISHTHLQVPNGYIIWKEFIVIIWYATLIIKRKKKAQLLNPLSVAHSADLLHRNKNKLAANVHTCMVLLRREGRVHIESDRRRRGDGGKERAGRSQEVGKENETGGGRRQRMTTSTCLNRRLSPPSDAPMLVGREEKRDREKGTQKAMTGLSLGISFSPLLPHNPSSHGQSSCLFTSGCPVWLFLFFIIFFFFIIFLNHFLSSFLTFIQKGQKSSSQVWVDAVWIWYNLALMWKFLIFQVFLFILSES